MRMIGKGILWAVVGLVLVGTLAGAQGRERHGVLTIPIPLGKPQETGWSRLTPYGYVSCSLSQALDAGGMLREIRILPSNGSFDSLLQLERIEDEDGESNYGLAIVQADALYHYLHGKHDQIENPHENSKIRAVMRLMPELVSLRTNPSHPQKRSFSEAVSEGALVRGFCGRVGAGHSITALNLRRLLELDVTFRFEPQPDLSTLERCEFRVDILSPRPGSVETGDSVVGLSKASANLMANSLGSTYRALHEDGRSYVFVDAILVATSSTPRHVIEGVEDWYKALPNQASLPSSKPYFGKLLGSSIQLGQGEDKIEPVQSIPAEWITQNCLLGRSDSAALAGGEPGVVGCKNCPPEHPKRRHAWACATKDLPVASHFEIRLEHVDSFWRYLARQRILQYIGLATGALAFAFGIATLLRQRRIRHPFRLKNALQIWKWKWRYARVASFLLGAHFSIALLIWLAEIQAQSFVADSKIVSVTPFEVLARLFDYLIRQEFYDLHSQMSVAYLGIFKLGYALGGIYGVGMISNYLLNWRQLNKMKNHVVVVGWNEHGPRLLKELQVTGPVLVVCVHSQDKIEELVNNSLTLEMPSMLFKRLGQLSLESARAVILLADQGWSKILNEDPDLLVGRHALEIKGYCERKNIEGLRVVAQVRRESHDPVVRELGVNKCLCIERFGIELLAQSALKPGVMDVVNELLHVRPDSNEIYFRSLTKEEVAEVGGDFMKLCKRVMEDNYEREIRHKALVLGIRRAGRLLLNPATDEQRRLQNGDEIVYLADEPLREGESLIVLRAASA